MEKDERLAKAEEVIKSNCVALEVKMLEKMIEQCIAYKTILLCVRERPDFLKIFSKDEIQTINKTDRTIEEYIKLLRRKKEFVESSKRTLFFKEELGEERLASIRSDVDTFKFFSNSVNRRLPEKPLFDKFFWFLNPTIFRLRVESWKMGLKSWRRRKKKNPEDKKQREKR